VKGKGIDSFSGFLRKVQGFESTSRNSISSREDNWF
jgi:hypothetical protein